MPGGHNPKTPKAAFSALETPNPPDLQDIEMESSASPAQVESDSDAPTRIQAQGRKRKADKQAENRKKPILRSAKKVANDPKEDIEPHTTARPENAHTKSGSSTTQQEDGAETPRKAASAKV